MYLSNDPDAKKRVIEVLIGRIDAKMAKLQSARNMLSGRLAEFTPTTDTQELRVIEEEINESVGMQMGVGDADL